MVVLQSVREELVHLGDTGSNAQVDGSVANVDDESTNDLGVNLRGGNVRDCVTGLLGRDVPRW
jgi:hypothetical protein